MITGYPATLTTAGQPWMGGRPSPSNSSAVILSGSSRYDARPRSRRIVVIAALVSAGLHAGLIFGFVRPTKKVAPLRDERVIALTIAMPDLKELEEPEAAPDSTEAPTDLATLVPMQADLPQLPRPDDFVQTINFTTLLEKPDFSNVTIATIPDRFRGGRQLAESIGKIFTLDELDRTPESVFQATPLYPVTLKREGQAGRVKVEFVVNTEGRVLDPHAVESSHHGFDEAAIAAVSKWKFRPGMKSGRKVNTRMAVPIVFEIRDQID